MKLVPYQVSNQSEAKEIAEIIKKYYPGSAYPPTFDKIMKGDIHYFRAMDGKQQIGICAYAPKTPTLVETVKTVIFSEFRGKGYGELVSQAIEDECKSVGFKKVMTTIYSTNTAMINIKLKQGYVIEGYHPDHEAPGFHEYSLGKVFK